MKEYKFDKELKIEDLSDDTSIDKAEEAAEPVVEKVEAEVVTTGAVIAKALNVRKGPGTEFVPVGTLYEGAKVEYTPENEEWLKLTNGGFVMKKFIQ